jgi:hypothetical protein
MNSRARSWFGIRAEDGVEAAVGLVVVVVVLVQHRQVDQRIEVDRRAGADALVEFDGLGILSPAVVEHRQAERRHLVVGVLAQGPLVELGGALVVAFLVRVLPPAEKLFRRPLVDRSHLHFVDGHIRQS